MRALVVTVFAITTLLAVTSANAVVCGRGPYRAGCVGRVHPYYHPYYHGCRWVWVNGVKVRRCY
jgi:hypothetical protein